MDAQTLATVLLIMRILAGVILFAVIIKQIINLRTTKTDYPGVRIAVFIGTIILFTGQFIPAILDAIVAFGGNYAGGRSRTPNPLGAAYALNNASKDLVIGALLAVLHFNPSARRPKGTPKDDHSVL